LATIEAFKFGAQLKKFYVYIMSSHQNGTLYIGVTGNLRRRVFEHKNKIMPGFSDRYDVNHLVYYEIFSSIRVAIEREKQLKHWNRDWKLYLIESLNPYWKDLSEQSLSEEDIL
jgi:putative endonuclease